MNSFSSQRTETTAPSSLTVQLTAEELEDQGIHQGTIRLSIGTENINDILADFEQAFN